MPPAGQPRREQQSAGCKGANHHNHNKLLRTLSHVLRSCSPASCFCCWSWPRPLPAAAIDSAAILHTLILSLLSPTPLPVLLIGRLLLTMTRPPVAPAVPGREELLILTLDWPLSLEPLPALFLRALAGL